MTVRWRRTSRNAAQRIGLVGSLAVALGIGAAVAGGVGFAHAESSADVDTTSANAASAGSPTGESPAGPPGAPDAADADTEAVAEAPESVPGLSERHSQMLSTTPARNHKRATRGLAEPRSATRAFDDSLRAAAVPVRAQSAEPALPAAAPAPEDETPTAYGDIGKWMRTAGGQIANWGGKLHDGRTLLESVNVIIVDPRSTSASQAARRLNHAMFWSGFPAQPLHSFGFGGRIDDVTYGQKPQAPWQSYSDNFFLFRNDHGRMFGPDPVETATGYVWSGAFSTEAVGFSGGTLGHAYVSSDRARNALAQRLVASGQATYAGMVPLENAYNTDTTTTGDHDGFAVVLVLTGSAVLPRREFVTAGPSGPMSADSPRKRTCAADAGAGPTPRGPGQPADLAPVCRLNTRVRT
jgi:hypothetical protein